MTQFKQGLSARVMKALSLFSGLQLLGIICSAVKMKLVALWLNATGVGLFGIYQSVADTIASFSDLGIRNSAVRDVASTHGNSTRLAVVMAVVRRWSLFTGLIGAAVVMGAAPLLGKWFFGSCSSCLGFMALGVSLCLNAVSGGEQALMQGAGRLANLARANLWATITGLALSIPLFRFCGNKGVVASIVVYAIALFVFVRIFRLRPRVDAGKISLRQVWNEGKGFARLGLCMALASFITSGAHTLFIGLVNTLGSTVEVGYVQAGDTIIIRYVGLIFTAIAMEFYPRIAAVSHSAHRTKVYVNHESILLLLVLTPLLLLFLLLREPVVRLLYREEFLVILPFISWGVVSSIPKALSWCMAYTIVARGDGRVYIITETLDALISVPVCILAYRWWGLAGLGVAYIVWYMLYALIAGWVYYCRYGLRLSRQVWLTAGFSLLTVFAALAAITTLPLWFSAPLLLTFILLCLVLLRRLLYRRVVNI